jgi:putative ABC transport system ATP-binding protein
MNEHNDNILIRTENLQKTYHEGGVPVHALRGISMDIKEGEFSAVVGPSGSGKTTLLNLISGLDRATKGTVTLNGVLLSDMSRRDLSDFRRDHVGFIFQAYNLIPVLTVEENVEYIMLLQGVPKQERQERVGKMLRSVGMENMIGRKPLQLSGGQQQRVAIARAMVSEPDLILADEPTANLDSKTGNDLLMMMRELNRSTGMTFLFSTHDEKVMDKARRLLVMEDGKIQSDKQKESNA